MRLQRGRGNRTRRMKSTSRTITDEEITEYLTKRTKKITSKVAKKLKSHTVSSYSNNNNDFIEKFVWRKKIERDFSNGVPLDSVLSIKSEIKRQKERMAEIEKVKKRREERVIKKAQHEEEMAMLNRERSKAEFNDKESKEKEVQADALEPVKEQEEEVQELEDEAGSFSPELMVHGDDNEQVIDPEDDKIELERKRIAVRGRMHEAMASKLTPLEDNMEFKANKLMGAMEDGDSVFGFGAEVNLVSQVYWNDKYRPRKPKYFNRVHTGYEWNKYNRTHYDHDNPPPKVVQGYKFNIFYPDLVDATKAPLYTMDKDDSNGETCLIRFHAGPPYEDIAFKIVNKEWEYSRKKGFKCTFERGILSVYFNFKRYPYRR